MEYDFELEDIGEGVTEGTLVAIHVAPDDAVAEDDLVAEVETDKAVVEVTSPVDGTVLEVHAAEGETVPVGETIVTFDVADRPDEGATEPADEGTDEPADEAETTAAESEPTPAVRRVGEDETETTEAESEPTPAIRRVEEQRAAPATGALESVPAETEVLIIGAGPGGYVAAIRAAQLGLDVTLVEKDAYGGTCLNYGCIPSKALIHGADIAYDAAHAEALGITADPAVDIDQLVDWKNDAVDQLTSGVERLCRGAGATLVDGFAEFVDDHRARIATDDGETAIDFDYAIVATGSRPIELPAFSFDSEHVLDSRDALALERLPDRLVVIGGGYIGMELSTVFQKLGTDVTVVEMFDDVLPGYDDDISRIVREQAVEFGVDFRFGEMATSWKQTDDGLVVTTEGDSGTASKLEADKVFVVGGREPVTETVNLEAVGIETDENGFIETDAQGRTSRNHIFAIGDVVGEPMLAHKASREGEVAAEAIAGEPAVLDYQAMPAAVFTDPEVATVGMTREQAAEAGYDPVVGRMPLSGNGRALTLGETDGFVRIVADSVTGLILGGQIVGPNASELIAEISLAIEMDARLRDIAETVHTHPTLAEAVMDAAANARGEAVHTSN